MRGNLAVVGNCWDEQGSRTATITITALNVGNEEVTGVIYGGFIRELASLSETLHGKGESSSADGMT